MSCTHLGTATRQKAYVGIMTELSLAGVIQMASKRHYKIWKALLSSYLHRIKQWLWLEETLKPIQFQSLAVGMAPNH